MAAGHRGVDRLDAFWALAPSERDQILLDAIATAHAWHYSRNRSYRQTVAARGVGADVESLPAGLARLLRPTAQTFKSYIDVTGSPFPQDNPAAFLEWLADQLSIDLPRARFAAFRPRYRSLEALLGAIEQNYADLGLELSTSSGTSGRSTIMVRDRDSTEQTVTSFYLAFLRYLGVEGVQRALFVMPRQTRIAMARMAAFSVQRLGLPDGHVHFAIPFPADPDRVRVRAGRTFRSGLGGLVERRFWHPFMGWMQEHVVDPQAVRTTIELLARAEAGGERLLMFGGWVQLHAVALALRQSGRALRLAAGSLLGTGGGLKELYPCTTAQIRTDLASVITLADGQPIPIRDVYGMAEGNWAAMQCAVGSYHIPPWIYARTLDDDGNLQRFAAQVNECQGRVIVVRPVADLMEVPERYLRMVPPHNLQSLSLAGGRPGDGLTAQFLRFADACGARGVTAIRVVGRGAFPQLAYSWDGLLPLDLVSGRAEGHFTTIEFDSLFDELVATYRLYLERGSTPGAW